VAGALAAAAAGRAGARTVLVEKEDYLGGTGYAALLQHICGLYLNGDTLPSETLNKGLVREVVHELGRTSPLKTVSKIGKVFVLPYDRKALRDVLESLCREQKQVTVMRESTLKTVERNEGTILSVGIENKGKRMSLSPEVVIDCSGNGEAAYLAGADFAVSPAQERQLAGYMMQITGLEQADETLPLKVPYYLAQAVKKGLLPASARFTTFSAGEKPEEGVCKMSMDEDDGEAREAHAKEQADAIHEVLKKSLPAFGNSRIEKTSLKVTEREGRRIIGAYTLTRKDVLGAEKFPDAVVKNAWPIELWDRARGTVYEYVPAGDYYEIPFRCMKVKGLSNLLTAGRCISVTREALGSTRVMGTCMSLGEQAGKAAAHRVKHGTWPSFLNNDT
jgi:hypothetical protein